MSIFAVDGNVVAGIYEVNEVAHFVLATVAGNVDVLRVSGV